MDGLATTSIFLKISTPGNAASLPPLRSSNDLRFLLLGSRTPGVFNLGGDLDLFAAKIRDRDRQALVAYGESCVRILHRNMNCLGLPMVTIGLAQGDALGGGFRGRCSRST